MLPAFLTKLILTEKERGGWNLVRKAGATDKKSKGSQTNETAMAGITGVSDYLQQMGSDIGEALDADVAKAARKPAEEVTELPFGGLADQDN